MPVHELAIRIDKLSENTLKTFSQLLVDGTSKKYIISTETAKISKKIHYHAYCMFESHQTYKSTTNHLRKSILKAFPDMLPYQYCIQKCKQQKEYLLYITKDLDIGTNVGFEEQELEKILETTKKINNEKKKKMKQQLVEYIFTEDVSGYRNIMKEIIKYHVSRDYLPPTPTLLFQYTCYVMNKLDHSTEELYMAKLGI